MRGVRGVGLALVDPRGVGVVASWTSSGGARTPSGPGWSWARVSTMKACDAGTSSQCFACGVPQLVPAMPSGPTVRSGSSAASGTNTVSPVLTVWSTPWSKNWPKKVNTELNGGERPTSVVMFGMNSVGAAACSPPGCLVRRRSAGRRSGQRERGRSCTAPPWRRDSARAPGAGCRDGCRVGRGLVDDQVADHARLGVDDVSVRLLVAGRAVPVGRRGGSGTDPRGTASPPTDGVGVPEAGWVSRGKATSAGREPAGGCGLEVVAGAVDGAQAVRREDVGDLVVVRDGVTRAGSRRVPQGFDAVCVVACPRRS